VTSIVWVDHLFTSWFLITLLHSNPRSALQTAEQLHSAAPLSVAEAAGATTRCDQDIPGFLKRGIPKSPWASISSHDHPWFGWFGVTCCISSHPEVWIIWNVQTNSPILYSEDCLSNPSPSYSRMTVLISLVQNWVRQGLDGSYIFILKLLKTHLNLVPCACDSTGAGSTPCSSTAGSTVGSWRTGQIEPKFRLIILLVTVNVDLLCSFKNSFSRIEK